MNRKLTILLTILAEVCRPNVHCKRTRSTPKMALRYMVDNLNWTQINLEFQEEFKKIPTNVPFHDPETTVLPTLKYQRGVNLTAYEINIRKEQAKIDKVIAERQKEIDAREEKWKAIRTEMDFIRKNMTAIRKRKEKLPKNLKAMERRKQLTKGLKDLKAKYNISSPDRNSFDVAYVEAKHAIVRMLKKHVRLVLNRTKFFHEFILRKNELSDELYDLRENMTKLDMLINEELELEYVVPQVRIKDIVANLTNIVKSVNVKGYRYKKAKSEMKYLVSMLNKYLNKTKHEQLYRKSLLPEEYIKLNQEMRNLSSQLRVEAAAPEIKDLQKLLRDKDEEYQDEKFYYYRRLLKLRELKMDRFVWEMNLTNFLKERTRKELCAAAYSVDISHHLRDESSINMRDNLLIDMIDEDKYYRKHGRFNKTTTANFEWQEVLNFDEDCKRYIHDNWWSFESMKHKDKARKRRRRRRNVVKDMRS